MGKGFTIIELVLVIIVAAIIAAVAVPQFGRYYSGIKVSNAAMKIASDIRYAQNRATTTQQRSQVKFTSTDGYDINACASYTSSTCTCSSWGTPVKAIDLTKTEFYNTTITGIAFPYCIEFDSLGKPYPNTTCSNPAVSCTTSAVSSFNVTYSGSPKTITVTQETGMVLVN